MTIGLSEQEVGRRLGISAEMVRQIMNHRMKDERRIDSDRGLTDVGMDEISLKKRHQLYATVLTDLKNLEQPRTLTVAWGRDQTAGHPAVEGSLPRGEEAWCGRRSREKKGPRVPKGPACEGHKGLPHHRCGPFENAYRTFPTRDRLNFRNWSIGSLTGSCQTTQRFA